jgi:capsular exopolysaccharide synthesis family protein
MGKTHEALLRAEQEYRETQQPTERRPFISAVPVKPKHDAPRDFLEIYEDLRTNLKTRYPDDPIKTILFNSTYHGVGCSTTAVNFATTLARNAGLKILLVDVNLRTPRLHEIFNIDRAVGLCKLGESCSDISSFIKRVGPGDLNVLTCGDSYSIPLGLFESDRFNEFVHTARSNFDYVILDAPPVPRFSECRVLCTKVDGVILVVEAGKTREQVALRAKKSLEEAGARILGVVINKRRYYIPQWLYSRL